MDISNLRFKNMYEDKSLRQICRETGHAFETVKKYVDCDDFNEQPKASKRALKPTKLDQAKKIIDEWIESDKLLKRKQRHSAKRIYQRLREEYPNLYTGSYRTVADYVKRRKHTVLESNKGFLPLTHIAGEAQIDFGTAEFMENGEKFTGKYLVLSFPASNGAYAQVFRGENSECFFSGLKIMFEYLGGVPSRLWFDNLSAAVVTAKIKSGKERQLTSSFSRFANHYNFQYTFCNPGAGHEKGHVENKVGYCRRNFFVPLPEFKSLKEYNITLLTKFKEDMERNHYKFDKSIKELHQQDIAKLLPLPAVPLDIFKYIMAKADKYGKVQLDKKLYSSEPNQARQQVWLKIRFDTVEVYDSAHKKIITHNRLYGKQKESMIWGPYLSLMAKRPAALKYCDYYNTLPQNWQEYISKIDYEEKKIAFSVLRGLLLTETMDTAEKILEKMLLSGVNDTASLKITSRNFLERKKNESITFFETSREVTFPSMPTYQQNNDAYNCLLTVGAK